MKRITLTTIIFSILLLNACTTSLPEKQIPPLVYDVEHTGADFPAPVFLSYDELPSNRALTDPLEWSDGSGRVTDFSDWAKRRAEIKAEIEHFEVGIKPSRPENITASYSKADSMLTVNVTVNDNTLTLTSRIIIPEGEGPFPALIGNLSPAIIESRKIATIQFNFTQVMSHTQTRGSEPINKLYPDLIEMGAYSAWPWGVSRLIDGLELVSNEVNIDMKHLAITGCSFAGKMALFAGAMDERIALTIAQEPGGGGAAAWRISQGLGNVETLGSTNYAWFKESMRQFVNSLYKLPFDHHELVAMVAPRALLVIGNPSMEWLADESGYISCKAAHKVWEDFGIPDRFGYSFVGDHGHCQLPESQYPEVRAFVDKFLFEDTTANTNVQIHPYLDVNAEMWYDGWTGESTFPEPDTSNVESVFYEAECSTYGSDWTIERDAEASNEGYVTINAGLNSSDAAPTDSKSMLTLPFTVSQDAKYYLFGRANCLTDLDDSFWIKIDNGEFVVANGLTTVGWQWVSLINADLTSGDHTLTITYREDGAKLDKIGISTYEYGPIELGDGDKAVENPCDL